MNKMADFAKLLGRKLGEKFIIKADKNFKAVLTDEGLRIYDNYSKDWIIRNNYLYDLISNKYEVADMPWKPKPYEIYYIPDPTMYEKYRKAKYIGNTEDEVAYDRGFICKTSEQAIEIAVAMMRVVSKMQGLDDREDA